MSTPFSTFCDDFYVNVRLVSQMALPHQRETLLHFYERIQKEIPTMLRFRKGEGGEFSLEEDRTSNTYRWLNIEQRRMNSGHVNPPSIKEAMKLHNLVMELAPYHLGISPVEIDHLDVMFGFDMCYSGNHDEVIAESLMADSPLNCLTEEPSARAVDFQPSVTVALNEDCRLQARLDIVTRTNSHQVRTGEYSDDVISVYLILRRYWGDQPRMPDGNLLNEMVERAEGICNRLVVPKILRPIGHAIAMRS
jgi:hypothetical protein